MINIKNLTRMLKTIPLTQYLPLYHFNNGTPKDRKPTDINYDKNKIPKTTIKLMNSKFGETLKAKQILEKCKAKFLEQLKLKMHQDLAQELQDIIDNSTTIEVLIKLFIRFSFKLDLNENPQALNEIVKFLMNEASKKISMNQTIFFFQLPLYTEFILKYDEAIIDILAQKNYSFALSLNFYTSYILNKMQNEKLKKGLFRHIFDVMAKTDLSEKQNFEALKQYLLKVEDYNYSEQKKVLDNILADQLMFFEAQTLKKMLITIYLSKSGFYFQKNQTNNIIEVMCQYCEDFVDSSSINQINQIILSVSKIRYRSPLIGHKQHQLQNLYFKTTLAHSFKDQTRKINELCRFINLFATKVDLLENEQPQLAQIVLTYFEKQIKLVKDRTQLLTTFSKINETLKIMISKNLFNYNICHKQFRKFFENINPIVQLAAGIEQIEQFIYIKDNISLLDQLQQFKKIDKSKRINPKKIYSILQKAIEKKDQKWIEEIMEHKCLFLHLNYSQTKENFSENIAIFNAALDLLYEKNSLKFLKKIFLTILSSKEREIHKIQIIFQNLLTWPRCQFEFIWQIFGTSWLEIFINQKKIELAIIYIELALWKKKWFPKQMGYLSNPLFYQILNFLQQICRKEKQIQKFQFLFYRLLSKVITRQNHVILLDSYIVPFLKDFKLDNQLFNQENQELINRLQSHIMLYKLKGLISEEQITVIYQKAIIQQDRIFTEREKMLITSTYSFYKKLQTDPLPIKERLLSLMATNDLNKQKPLYFELSQSNKFSAIKPAIFNFTAKQLISLLLSPLFEVDLVKYSWQILLAKDNLQFQYLDWKTLLQKYYVSQNFAPHAANLTKKVIEYYSKHLNLLILQDIQIINTVFKQSKIKIDKNILDTFLRYAFKLFLQKRLDDERLDQLLAWIYQTKVQLSQQLATAVMQQKLKKTGATCIYLFILEQNLNKQDYIRFLRNYFMVKIAKNIPQLPFQVELYFKKNYPGPIQSYLTKISDLTSNKRDVFVYQKNIRFQLKQIQKTYQNVEVNLTYNFIITGDQLLLFTNELFQNIYPTIFRTISELIPVTVNKSVTIIVVNESGVDINSLAQKYSWNKKSKKSIKVDSIDQPQPEIKDLELQRKLAQNIAELQLAKDRSQQNDKKTSQNSNAEKKLI